jgi:hypothetical protein
VVFFEMAGQLTGDLVYLHILRPDILKLLLGLLSSAKCF